MKKFVNPLEINWNYLFLKTHLLNIHCAGGKVSAPVRGTGDSRLCICRSVDEISLEV